MTFDPMLRRDEIVGALSQGAVDVLVIGGGIVGAGVAREAALAGLSVLLVEQHDFAFGTSSRSSRLLHGGLRYLAQGRIGLVREAGREKKTLRRIAPHLAKPLEFTFPTYRGRGPSRWLLRLGVAVYDMLCLGNLGDSRSLSRAETLAEIPALRAERLTGAVRYFDALTNDARLVIDTLRSASKAGASLLNYVRYLDSETCSQGRRCRLRDALGGHDVEIVARVVLNAAGAWGDRIPTSGLRLRPTKGIHLVVDRSRLPVPTAVVLPEGKRILFVIPWGDRLIIGTTDTDYDGSLDDVRASDEDIGYLLGVVNAAFPNVALGKADILATYAGLRPLIANKRGEPSDISRSHEILATQPGWIDVAGGKLTTYRLMGEQTVAAVFRQLGRPAPQSRTATLPLLEPSEVDGVSGIIPPPIDAAAVRHYCEREWAIHLDDVLVRRSGWHYYHGEGTSLAPRVAGWMADTLGWDQVQVDQELERFRRTTETSSRAVTSKGSSGQPFEQRLPS